VQRMSTPTALYLETELATRTLETRSRDREVHPVETTKYREGEREPSLLQLYETNFDCSSLFFIRDHGLTCLRPYGMC